MSAVDPIISIIINNGVAVGVLVWFMLRLEKKLEEFTVALNSTVSELKEIGMSIKVAGTHG
jgi:hypothetical protein